MLFDQGEPLRQCRVCGRLKPLTDFHLVACRNRRRPWVGRLRKCKACTAEYEKSRMTIADVRARKLKAVREHDLKTKYGLSLQDVDRMVTEQAGRCLICLGELGAGKTPHVDHCHVTQQVRGVLCRNCNTAIGMLGDDVANVLRAADYLLQRDKREDGHWLPAVSPLLKLHVEECPAEPAAA